MSHQIPEVVVQVNLKLFGGLSVVLRDGSERDMPNRQTSALLAYLALFPNRTHLREELLALLWPDAEPEKARQNLRQCLKSLRESLEQAFGDADMALITTRDRIGLNPAIVTDAAQFEKAIACAKLSRNSPERVEFLKRALAHYRGELLIGFYQDCFELERTRLAELHRQALHLLIDELSRAGEIDQAIQVAHRIVLLDPLSEDACRKLMQLYAEFGEPGAVNRQFREFESRLKKDLGIEPQPETAMFAARCEEEARGHAVTRSPARPERKFARTAPDSALPQYVAARHQHFRFAATISAFAAVGLVAFSFGRGRTIQRAGNFFVESRISGARVPALQNISNVNTQIGKETWVAQFTPKLEDGKTAGAEPTAMTVDRRGNVYVTGFINTVHGDADFVTLKISPKGQQLWERRYNGPGNDLDRAKAITVDSTGNVYVTGESDGGKGHSPERLNGLDIATIKYSPNGTQLWVRRFSGPSDGMDSGRQICLDAAENVYVFGQSWGGDPAHGGSGSDAVVIQYSPSGAQNWVRRIARGTTRSDAAKAMFVDKDGNAFVVLETGGLLPGIETAKIDRGGRLIWYQTYRRSRGEEAHARTISVDRAGNVVVVGWTKTGGQSPTADYLILKYDPHGRLIWEVRYPWAGGVNVPMGVVIDGANTINVIGAINGHPNPGAFGLLRLNSKGEVEWARIYQGTGRKPSWATSIGVNSQGQLLVTGTEAYQDPLHPNAYDADKLEYATMKYGSDGAPQELHRFQLPEGEVRVVGPLVVDGTDRVIVTGMIVCGQVGRIVTVAYAK